MQPWCSRKVHWNQVKSRVRWDHTLSTFSGGKVHSFGFLRGGQCQELEMGLSQGRREALHFCAAAFEAFVLVDNWPDVRVWFFQQQQRSWIAHNLWAIGRSEESLLSSLCCRWTSAQQVHTSSKKVADFSPKMWAQSAQKRDDGSEALAWGKNVKGNPQCTWLLYDEVISNRESAR